VSTTPAFTTQPRAATLGKVETCSANDPLETAKEAGLMYVTDAVPGIQRKRAGKHFSYIGLDGKPIHNPKELERISKIGIPPAWKQVWISPKPKGYVQATGCDAKGRKQYRYHPRWREVRDETKYDRMIALGELESLGTFDSQTQARKNVVDAITSAAMQLGNTPAICRKCYVHPAALDAYMDGSLLTFLEHYRNDEKQTSQGGWRPEEAVTLAFLRQLSET